jgi:hypothetical protein
LFLKLLDILVFCYFINKQHIQIYVYALVFIQKKFTGKSIYRMIEFYKIEHERYSNVLLVTEKNWIGKRLSELKLLAKLKWNISWLWWHVLVVPENLGGWGRRIIWAQYLQDSSAESLTARIFQLSYIFPDSFLLVQPQHTNLMFLLNFLKALKTS